MKELIGLLSAHPLHQKKPYNSIKFVRFDGNGAALYSVSKEAEVGAYAALKVAFERYGGHCFHCGKFMKAQPLSHDCTRDHVRPRAEGGKNALHNLLLSCGPCNRAKGKQPLIQFSSDGGKAYLEALEQHLQACLGRAARIDADQ